MRFPNLKQHLESAPGLAGAARRAWDGKAYITIIGNGLRLVIGDGFYQYAFSFEDAAADDWEPV